MTSVNAILIKRAMLAVRSMRFWLEMKMLILMVPAAEVDFCVTTVTNTMRFATTPNAPSHVDYDVTVPPPEVQQFKADYW